MAGLSIAAFGTYAASIDANIISFRQYIQEFFVTSDGTPDGDIIMQVNTNNKAITANGEIELTYDKTSIVN